MITPRVVAFRRAVATMIITIMVCDVSISLNVHWLGIFLKFCLCDCFAVVVRVDHIVKIFICNRVYCALVVVRGLLLIINKEHFPNFSANVSMHFLL